MWFKLLLIVSVALLVTSDSEPESEIPEQTDIGPDADKVKVLLLLLTTF